MMPCLALPPPITRRLLPLAVLAAALSATAGPASAAEQYPARPVRLIIPSGAGGITDILGRVLAPKLTESLGQQVVVDNRPGASGIVGSQIVAKSTPDGYTLLMVFPSHPVNPSLYPDIPFDTLKAFAPVTLVSAVSPVLIVNSQFPAKSVAELIAIAKEKPGQLNHGSVGSSSMGHLGAELFRSMAGVRFALVTYKGAPQVLTALLSGEIQFYLIGSAGTVVPQVKAGRIRALGVGARQRIAALPDVPSISETLPGYEARGWNGILAPAGTPRPVIERLNREIVKVVRSPEFGQVLAAEGATAVGNTPAEFDAVIRADVQKWAKIIKEAGIKAQ
jgi:tripartite-type tricarboxylate transporter receptor subunit TctC